FPQTAWSLSPPPSTAAGWPPPPISARSPGEPTAGLRSCPSSRGRAFPRFPVPAFPYVVEQMLLCIPGERTKLAAGELLNLPRRRAPAVEVPSLNRALHPHVHRERFDPPVGKQQDAVGDFFTHPRQCLQGVTGLMERHLADGGQVDLAGGQQPRHPPHIRGPIAKGTTVQILQSRAGQPRRFRKRPYTFGHPFAELSSEAVQRQFDFGDIVECGDNKTHKTFPWILTEQRDAAGTR